MDEAACLDWHIKNGSCKWGQMGNRRTNIGGMTLNYDTGGNDKGIIGKRGPKLSFLSLLVVFLMGDGGFRVKFLIKVFSITLIEGTENEGILEEGRNYIRGVTWTFKGKVFIVLANSQQETEPAKGTKAS